MEWEDFKSGEWIHHANSAKRLAFMQEHDPEGFKQRIALTELALEREIQAMQ